MSPDDPINPGRPSVKDVLRKHSAKIESQFKGHDGSNVETERMGGDQFSREYIKFKAEMAPDLSRYESWCRGLGSIIKLKVSEKDRLSVEKHIKIAHLDIEPWQALTLAVVSFVGVFLLGVLVSVAILLITETFPILFFSLTLVLSLFLFYFTKGYPKRLAGKWRLKASSQMVPAILYMVVYMRHTPNLERAVAFASEHLQFPLALDFRKVFYDVKVGKFSTIKESLDNYLDGWRDYSIEFIEAFHLIESSLFEPNNDRRIVTLEKSLQVILDGVYDKMLKFTHGVRSPLTNVYMLGVVLPTLGLALLPLASAMLGGLLKWYHVFLLFNLIVPFFVFYLTDKILLLRPGGHGESGLLERNPLYHKYKSKAPYFNAFLITFPLLLIGILPLIFQYTPIPGLLGMQTDYTFAELGLSFLPGLENERFFGFTPEGKGPFGVGALFFGMFIPLGIALFFSMSFKARTKELIVERDKTIQLEKEFNNSLFQLGNRLGNGVPSELVFGKVAESSKGLITEDFFRRVNYNIRQMGMSVEKAIFDKNRGALIYYPSNLLATSMKVLIESAKKGLKIAAVSLMRISEYLKNIQKITNRLKDMLAEIISDMKSNMTFLAPLLSGVVVGLAAMITGILGKLELAKISGGTVAIGGLSGFDNIFEFASMVPPYFLQISIGIYLIQIIFILTGTLVTIESGEDKLEKTNKSGKNLSTGITLYFITALLSTFALFMLSAIVLKGIG